MVSHTHCPVFQVEGRRGISIVADVSWLVEGSAVDEMAQRLEQCAAASLRWADLNAVRFEAPKIEVVHFSRKRKHWQAKGEMTIWVGDQ